MTTMSGGFMQAPVTEDSPRSMRPKLHSDNYPPVDVAIIMESTYPFLKGGVSAVVHDIVTQNPDVTFGVVHITWDSYSPSVDLYGMPDNVKWVAPVFLAMTEHRSDFMAAKDYKQLGNARRRRELSHRIIDACEAIARGETDAAWSLYDEGLNPRTRSFPLWSLLGSKEWMIAMRERWPGLNLPLVDTFWLMREFFSLMYAVMASDIPYARVYHAHTTGYAAWFAAAGARQNDTSFLLTEHNLYTRDTINTLLDRDMSLHVTSNWHDLEADPTQRAWMAWWVNIGLMSYALTDCITFLYPKVFGEAAAIGAPVSKGVVVPNGVRMVDFAQAYNERLKTNREIRQQLSHGETRKWELAFIARIVPIKGLADLIDSVALLVQRGVTDFHIDLLGPTNHVPWYYEDCVAKIETLQLNDYFTFRGTVNVREVLSKYDMLVLPSHNEGQPIVILEAMVAGLPTLGTVVGGNEQLVSDDLVDRFGQTWGPCGSLAEPGDVEGMADQLQKVMGDLDLYLAWSANARVRVEHFFQLEDAMSAYNRLYRDLGHLPDVKTSRHVAEVDLRDQVVDLHDPLREPPRHLASTRKAR